MTDNLVRNSRRKAGAASALGAARMLGGRALGAAAILLALWGAWNFPSAPVALTAGFALYVVLLIRWPACWLLVIPAALPVLDLTYWSGRLFFNEFDLLLLATLGGGMLHHAPGRLESSRGLRAAVVLLTLYHAVVIWSGLGEVPEFAGLWQENDYFKSANALREGKGFIWALALLPMLMREHRSGVDLARWTSAGLVAGLVLAGLSVLWERPVYRPFQF